MNSHNKFWWFTVFSVMLTLVVIGALLVYIWQQLSASEQAVVLSILREQGGYLFGVFILFIAALGFGGDAIVHNYIIPSRKICEQTTLMQTANPAHRIEIEGSQELRELACAINEGANRYERLFQHVEKRVEKAMRTAERDKNLLAAVISELPEGIIICNARGEIIFYNKKARQLLCRSRESENVCDIKAYIGLGRSIYDLLDAQRIHYAMEEIASNISKNETVLSSFFFTSGTEGYPVRAEIAPILDDQHQPNGYILLFADQQRELADAHMEQFRHAIDTQVRQGLAVIQLAAELLRDHSHLQPERSEVMQELLYQETLELGRILDPRVPSTVTPREAQWPPAPVIPSAFATGLQRKLETESGLHLSLMLQESIGYVRLDSYSMLQALSLILQNLQQAVQVDTMNCVVCRKSAFFTMDFCWSGPPLDIANLRQWYQQTIQPDAAPAGGGHAPLTVKAILAANDADLCLLPGRYHGREGCLRLFLPLAELQPALDPDRTPAIIRESRPVFLAFDLFNRPDRNTALDTLPLTDLIFTVFDTETTGLEPRQGDEIISLAAVRIVNNHLLDDEVFSQLVNPCRNIPVESTRIHGIQPDMLINQPTIDKVLPAFARFAAGSVLVAHNAAFDMCMLAMKESQTGVVFNHPVLDTMLLSAVVHTAQQRHSLEAIAARLGEAVTGRHTAMGDAMVTARLFLKLLPLLERKGIYTLEQARQASQRVPLAQLKY